MAEEKAKKFTKYEKARMIGSRAMQLSMGAPMAIKLTKAQLEEINYNPIEIAKKEFTEGKIPLKILEPIKRNREEEEAEASKEEAEA